MELWIRTQNKEKILKVDNLEFLERNGHKYIASNMDLVASYKTKERALEILDEIQNFITRTDELSYIHNSLGIEIQGTSEKSIVYIMPQE